MTSLVTLILIGALGFVASRFLFLHPKPGTWYERFMLSGAEFLILGAVIGPLGLEILDQKTLLHLEPFLVLALSWVGLLFGLQLRWRHLIRFPWAYFQLAGVQALVTLAVTFGALAALFFLWSPVAAEAEDLWRGALCLAAVATLSSPSAAAVQPGGSVRAGHMAGLLRFVAAFDPIISLLAIGFLFSFFHGGGAVLGLDFNGIQWLLASVIAGLVLGSLFLLLLWSTEGSDELVLVVLGMALFSGGLASVFHLSPLVICLIEGIVLSNWRPQHERILYMFMRLERPLYIILLVLAGAAWRFEEPWGYLLAGVFVLVKIGGKFLGVRTALAVTKLPFELTSRWWKGLVPQGAMAIAIAVTYQVAYRDNLGQVIFSSVLVSTVVFAFISRGLVRSALSEDDGS